MSDTILEVKNLTKHFKTKRGMLHAVDGINFSVKRGQTLGLVGESGCGKTTVGRTLLRLIEPTSGEIIFEGKNITKISLNKLRHVRKDMQLIFLDPNSSKIARKKSQPNNQRIHYAYKILNQAQKFMQDNCRANGNLLVLPPLYSNSYPIRWRPGVRQRIGYALQLAKLATEFYCLRGNCFCIGCIHSGTNIEFIKGVTS